MKPDPETWFYPSPSHISATTLPTNLLYQLPILISLSFTQFQTSESSSVTPFLISTITIPVIVLFSHVLYPAPNHGQARHHSLQLMLPPLLCSVGTQDTYTLHSHFYPISQVGCTCERNLTFGTTVSRTQTLNI